MNVSEGNQLNEIAVHIKSNIITTLRCCFLVSAFSLIQKIKSEIIGVFQRITQLYQSYFYYIDCERYLREAKERIHLLSDL